MAGSKSKRKGKYFEEQVAKYFRQALNESRKNIHRAFTSGISSIEDGDITFVNYRIIVECKNHATFSYFDLFPKLSTTLYKFYRQIQKKDSHLHILAINNSSDRKFKPLAIIEYSELQQHIANNVILQSVFNDSHIITYHNDIKFFVQELKAFIFKINFDVLRRV